MHGSKEFCVVPDRDQKLRHRERNEVLSPLGLSTQARWLRPVSWWQWSGGKEDSAYSASHLEDID